MSPAYKAMVDFGAGVMNAFGIKVVPADDEGCDKQEDGLPDRAQINEYCRLKDSGKIEPVVDKDEALAQSPDEEIPLCDRALWNAAGEIA